MIKNSVHGPTQGRRNWYIAIALPLGLLGLSGCEPGQAAPQATKPAEVVITKPVTEMVTDYREFTGRLDAFRTVDVRARVSGYITEAPFHEGDEIHAGDLLFQIDPMPYEADFNVAEANVKQAMADEKLQEKNADRARQLMRSGSNSISQEEFDQALAALEKARATVRSMEAARDRSKLFLEYTHVVAAHNGRASRRYVDPGNLVKADDTLLTTLVADDQVYAYFDVDERTYLGLPGATPVSRGGSYSGVHFPVQMAVASEASFNRSGIVDFVDNRVSATTGTIRMRGIFPNADHALKSGMFARIRLPLGPAHRAILIPEEALLSDQGRRYVFVVNDANKAVYRPVNIGQAVKGMRVIMPPADGKEGKEGLSLNDRVIISGTQRVRNGSIVEPKMPASTTPAASTASSAQPAATSPSSRQALDPVPTASR